MFWLRLGSAARTLRPYLHPKATFATVSQSPASESIKQFHELYYGAPEQTWQNTFWLGVRTAKCPFDLWIYQEILCETRPDLIVECGTAWGGSALFMASVLDQLGLGAVATIDVDAAPERPPHPRISYISGSSTSPEVVAEVRHLAASSERLMVVLDSDHTRDHVAEELRLYAPLVTSGCYLVVEDTNVNGNPVLPKFGPGPQEAVAEFLAQTDDFGVDHEREKLMLTFNPNGYLRRR